MLGVFRQNWIKATQKADLVRVPDAGPLKILHAPLGHGSVQTWAQARGNLRFVGRRGIRGVLHLKDDTVTIQRPRSAPRG